MVSIEEFLEAGVHFGHRVTKWNPRMAPYIFAERKGVHIIDLVQTLYYFKQAVQFLNEWKKNKSKQSILLVGTKKQASQLVQSCAEKLCQNGFSAHYVNHRWLGGLLTNWSTMKICIDQLNTLELREQKGEFETLPKKEKAILKKEYDKLNLFFGGVKKMNEKPNLVIIIGQDTEMNAVRECYKLGKLESAADPFGMNASGKFAPSKLTAVSSGSLRSQESLWRGEGIRTITLLDTNCDPSLADIFIPANDDSTKSLELILNKLTNTLISDMPA
jgi:small subunit ribosomal protein S2